MSKAKQMQKIKQVSILLGSAVLCAFLLAAFMIYHYGPTGHYYAGSTILTPTVLNQMSFTEFDPNVGAKSRFVYNGTEFTYFDERDERQHQVKVDPTLYEKFYTLVASDESQNAVDEEVQRQFNRALAVLSSSIRSDKPVASPTIKVFQVIQFSPQDYYRVKLLNNQQRDEWAYFFHPNIYQEVIHLFKGEKKD